MTEEKGMISVPAWGLIAEASGPYGEGTPDYIALAGREVEVRIADVLEALEGALGNLAEEDRKRIALLGRKCARGKEEKWR